GRSCGRIGVARRRTSRSFRFVRLTRRRDVERVVSVRALPDYRLEVEFTDGTRGVIDCSGELWGPVFEPLRDPARFAEVAIDEFGAVYWPSGADLAPDAMYEEIKRGKTTAR